MVTTVAEAECLITAQARSGSIVVIAFQGALSPLVLDTKRRASAGEFGELVGIAATIWEDWAYRYEGHWKQKPELSGGGFMFDTGAHMMNTVCLLADAEFERISAYASNRGRAIDIVTAVAGRLANDALVTLTAAGEGPIGCASHIAFFYTKAIVRIDAWGAWREISSFGSPAVREETETRDNPMKTFLAIRAGAIENPSTVEGGLRFARLWDAVKASAARNGESVDVKPAA
jgi:predicted dehydrogenase